MDINGYRITSEPSGLQESIETFDDVTGEKIVVIITDGFASTVTNMDGLIRGPFRLVRDAIQCAHEWKSETEELARAKLKAVDDAAPTSPVIENLDEETHAQTHA